VKPDIEKQKLLKAKYNFPNWTKEEAKDKLAVLQAIFGKDPDFYPHQEKDLYNYLMTIINE